MGDEQPTDALVCMTTEALPIPSVDSYVRACWRCDASVWVSLTSVRWQRLHPLVPIDCAPCAIALVNAE